MILVRLNSRVSLRARLYLGSAAVLLTVGIAIVLLTTIKESREYRGDIKQEAEVTLTILERELTREVIIGDFATIEEILRDRARRDNIDTVVWQDEGMSPLVARNGNTVAARPEWFASLINIGHPAVSRDLVVGGVPYGKITVSFNAVPMENRLWQSVLLNVESFAAMLVLMFVFLAVILRAGLAPLERLVETAWGIGAGDFSRRVPEFPGDAPDMRVILGAFNRMADNVETLLVKLAEQRRAIDNAALVTETDLNGIITYANEKFCSLIGYKAEELLGGSHNIVNSGEHPPEFFAMMWQTILGGEVWNGEIAIRTRQGELRWMATAITPVLGSDGTPVKFVAIRFDVTEKKLAEQALRQSHDELEQKVAERTHALEDANHRLATLSSTDGLTGIANRRHFDEVLANEWNRAVRVRQPLALLMIDVDLFKNYNDHYGHQMGDDCLRKIAEVLLASSRRASDLAARYGGEEFVLIAVDTDIESAQHLAEVVRTSIASLGKPHAESPYGKVTVSIGVAALIPDNTQQPELLIQRADKALYHAKNHGRNRVDIFE